jgi:GNAT superfamily N-acetyltransferase
MHLQSFESASKAQTGDNSDSQPGIPYPQGSPSDAKEPIAVRPDAPYQRFDLRKLEFKVIDSRELGLLKETRELEMSHLFMKSKLLLLATFDGEFVGIAGIRGILNTESTEISERFRGLGVGKVLVMRLALVARERGEKFILSDALVTNLASLRMTARLGFLDIFEFSGSEGVERMTMLPLSTFGWFTVISLRLLRRADPRILGRLFTTIQFLVGKT